QAFTVQVIKGFDYAASITGDLSTDLTQFELKGPINAGDEYAITIGSARYALTATSADNNQSIASALAGMISGALNNRYLDLYVRDIGLTSDITQQDTIQRRGQQTTGYVEMGYQLYGYALRGRQATDGSGRPIFLTRSGVETTDPSVGPIQKIVEASLTDPLY